jgi:hypothetical protein
MGGNEFLIATFSWGVESSGFKQNENPGKITSLSNFRMTCLGECGFGYCIIYSGYYLAHMHLTTVLKKAECSWLIYICNLALISNWHHTGMIEFIYCICGLLSRPSSNHANIMKNLKGKHIRTVSTLTHKFHLS